MVAADYMMKRLAMGLDRAPIAGLPSYVSLFTAQRAPKPRATLPRWWLTPAHLPAARSPDGLAWQLRGRGARVHGGDAHLEASGTVAKAGPATALTAAWAAAMTEHYDELASELPVFDQLVGCMDLAIAAAIMTSERWLSLTRMEASLLVDRQQLLVEPLPVPRTIRSHAGLARSERAWTLSVSGGVELALAGIINQPRADPQLAKVRDRAEATGEISRWWWD